MDVEIITIGDELLMGQTVDTNSVFLAKSLAPLGLNISRKVAIKDEKSAIIGALDDSLSRVNIVLITGGLGPTNDDITQKVLQDYFDSGMRTDENVLEHLKKILKNRDPQIFELNKKQANLPEKAITLFNSEGTAPGMLFKQDNKWIAAMPGVPGEVRAIMHESLIPLLKSEFQLSIKQHKTLTTLLIPESVISHKLQEYESQLRGLSLAYLPSFNMVKIRLTQNSDEVSSELFSHQWEQLKEQLGAWVFSENDDDLSYGLLELMRKQQWHIATAESCTGGYIGNQLVLQAGASDVYKGSIIAYNNDVKSNLLGVDPGLIRQYGAVSAEVAEAMVRGVCESLQTEVGISTTGIAGPGGGSVNKPVGTVYIGIKIMNTIRVEKYQLRGNRSDFMIRAFNASMKQLKDML